MAFNFKSLIKIFIIFFLFQFCANAFIEASPSFKNYAEYSEHNIQFLNYMTIRVNAQFSGEQQGVTLLDNLRKAIDAEGTLDENFLSQFWGILKTLFNVIRFIINLFFAMTLVPGVLLDLLFYGLALGSIPTILSVIISVVTHAYMFGLIIQTYKNK